MVRNLGMLRATYVIIDEFTVQKRTIKPILAIELVPPSIKAGKLSISLKENAISNFKINALVLFSER